MISKGLLACSPLSSYTAHYYSNQKLKQMYLLERDQEFENFIRREAFPDFCTALLAHHSSKPIFFNVSHKS